MKDLVKSVLKVFDGKQKRKLVGMMFLILINTGVSLLGVSVLSPFITAVMNPEQLLKNDTHWKFFVDNIEILIEKYEYVRIDTMGFPDNWKSLLSS